MPAIATAINSTAIFPIVFVRLFILMLKLNLFLLYSSLYNSSILCILSSAFIDIPCIIACFCLLVKSIFSISDKGTSLSLSILSIDSLGSFPVSIKYIVAHKEYTSDQLPCLPLRRYCSSEVYPLLNVTVRLLSVITFFSLAEPKSIRTSCFSFILISILSGLMSLCRIFAS